MINTDSIKDLVRCLDNNDFNNIKELNINRFDITGEITRVDFNDLNYFPNLEALALNNLTINDDDLIIISNLKKIVKLCFINCDFTGDIITLLNNMKLKELVLDNSLIDLKLLTSNYDKLTISNMKYITNNLSTNILDISKADVNISDINNIKSKQLIISHKQYFENKEFFNILKSKMHITVMEDNQQFVEVEL